MKFVKFQNEVLKVLMFAQRFLALRNIMNNATVSDDLAYISNPETECLTFDNLLERISQEMVRCIRYLDHLEFFAEANFNFINIECEVNLDVVIQPYRYSYPKA